MEVLGGVAFLLLLFGVVKGFKWLQIQWKVSKDLDRRTGDPNRTRNNILTVVGRFAALYCIYCGLSYPFVSVRKSDYLWIVGVCFAAGATYVWCSIKRLKW